MKHLFIILSCLILVACSHDYAEDSEYVHIHKNSTACKVISRQEIHPSRTSTPYIEVKHKCVYIKKTTEKIPAKVDPELLNILEGIDKDA